MLNLDENDIPKLLRDMGLLHDSGDLVIRPLSGGVSSDVLRVEGRGGTLCVKRACPRLRVAADWHAPIGRNQIEVAWLRNAATIIPNAVPAVLGDSPEAGLFVMAYLDPARHPVWKSELLAGRVDAVFAAQVGSTLAKLHGGSTDDPAQAQRFADDESFHALRIEPYLRFTATRHPTLAGALDDLAHLAGTTKIAVIHGDVSPKNLLVGPDGPVFIDAECACFGDPAFDLAFCLSHLLLKSMRPGAAPEPMLACFDALVGAYLAAVDWEDPRLLEARASRYLPGLLLGRIDGKSPIEYITHDFEKDSVRTFASRHLQCPPLGLFDLRRAWTRDLTAKVAA